MKVEIFQANGLNGTKDWHVESTYGNSFSYYIGTFDRPGVQELTRDSQRKLKQKGEAWGEAVFEIRQRDMAKTVGGSL